MSAQTKINYSHLGLTFFSAKNSTMSYKVWAIYSFNDSIPAGKLLHHIPMNELDLPPPMIVRKGGDFKKWN